MFIFKLSFISVWQYYIRTSAYAEVLRWQVSLHPNGKESGEPHSTPLLGSLSVHPDV